MCVLATCILSRTYQTFNDLFQVIAVEPYRESIYRIHQAASTSQLTSQITVLENALSDTRGPATIRQSGDNQGDTKIEMGVSMIYAQIMLKVEKAVYAKFF